MEVTRSLGGITDKIMKRTKLLILFTILFLNQSFCQGYDSDINLFLKSVAYIYEEKVKTEEINGSLYELWLYDKKNNSSIPYLNTFTGTGFFVISDLDIYLVTAEHVANTTSLNTIIVVSKENDLPFQVNLKDIIYEKSLKWTINPIADVAVLHIDLSKIKDTLFINPMPVEMINDSMEAPLRIRDVTVYGYPLNLGIGKKLSPISKTLKPASGIIELPRIDNNKTCDFFLLDDPSISGFSGGPVIELPQEIGLHDKKIFVKSYRLMGLVHGTFNDKTGGFAAIVPAKYIKETVDSAPRYSGSYKFYYPDGKFWSERIYKNGIPWSVISNLNSLGINQEKGTLYEGNGTLIIYDEKGKMIEKREYLNGKLIKSESFEK
ncbi:MAG: S1C family serine protease [Bacteroidota bacterium]